MNSEIEILFEDQWLLAVNKPPGLPTQPTVDKKRPSLYSVLLESKKWSYLGLHHRLDVPTSGVVLLTKHKEANKGVADLFKERNAEKNYQCLAHGIPAQAEFEFKNYLKPLKLKTGKTKMVSTQAGGDFAHTVFNVLETFSKESLILASPQTGRMHQIRTHLAELTHPILGDSLYFRVDRHYPRLMLHAFELKCDHPITKKPLIITAPLPEDFERALARLRTKASPS